LLLEEKTVILYKLKGSVGKLLGNTAIDSRSHYQRLHRWLNPPGVSTKKAVGSALASLGKLTHHEKHVFDH
jgi:hypothetical protein